MVGKDYTVVGDSEGRYRVIELNEHNLGDYSKRYKRYQALLSIKQDLRYANQYLVQMFFDQGTSLIDGALINSAMQLIVKCFTNHAGKGRMQLDKKSVFSKYAVDNFGIDYETQYDQILNYRRHSISHDESDFEENRVGLTIDLLEHSVVELTHIKMRHHFIYKQNAELYKKMIEVALAYVDEQVDVLMVTFLDYFKTLEFEVVCEFCNLICEGLVIENKW